MLWKVTDLSTGTIQNCLASVATIKSHIYDNETSITPLSLAYNVTGNKEAKTTGILINDFKLISDEIKNLPKS
jgi:hypothetical protein